MRIQQHVADALRFVLRVKSLIINGCCGVAGFLDYTVIFPLNSPNSNHEEEMEGRADETTKYADHTNKPESGSRFVYFEYFVVKNSFLCYFFNGIHTKTVTCCRLLLLVLPVKSLTINIVTDVTDFQTILSKVKSWECRVQSAGISHIGRERCVIHCQLSIVHYPSIAIAKLLQAD